MSRNSCVALYHIQLLLMRSGICITEKYIELLSFRNNKRIKQINLFFFYSLFVIFLNNSFFFLHLSVWTLLKKRIFYLLLFYVFTNVWKELTYGQNWRKKLRYSSTEYLHLFYLSIAATKELSAIKPINMKNDEIKSYIMMQIRKFYECCGRTVRIHKKKMS